MELGSRQRLEPPLSGKESPALPGALKKLYCGEPLALGITQIIVGILEITFGILLDVEKAFLFYGAQLRIPQLTGIVCIIAGLLSVVAAKNPKKPLVKSMLALNVVSMVTASLALGMSSCMMGYYRRPGIQYSGCSLETNSESLRICRETNLIPYATQYGVIVIILLFHALLLLISFFISVLGCVTLCHGLGNYDTLTTVVVYQTQDMVAPAVPSPSKEVKAP